MDTQRLRSAWQQLEVAVDFIESRLDHPFDATAVAAAASMSVWQLHRLFQATVGESLMDYVRRRRLARTLVPLRDGRRRILDIALEAGFDSHEVFCRSFRREYRCAPGDVRRGACAPIPYPRPRLEEGYLLHRFHGMQLQPEMRVLSPLHVAGRVQPLERGQGPGAIPALWRTVLSEAGYPAAEAVGLTEVDVNRPNQLRYTAGLPWRGGALPPGWTERTLRGGLHACFDHVGPVEQIEYTVHYVHAVWLPQSDWEPADVSEREHYPEGWRRDGSGPPLRLCIPVTPKVSRS